MKNTELTKEVERLRRKLSPLEDKEFTEQLRKEMAKLDLSTYRRKFRQAEYIVLTPKQVSVLAGMEPNRPTLTNIGRSLQALCWERSALHGHLVFVMPIEEYNETIT